MIRREITYKDFNGTKKKAVLYFHVTKTELTSMVASGIADPDAIRDVIDSKDKKRMYEMMNNFVLGSYGIKSEDGEQFVKSKEVREAFLYSAAYDAFMTDLMSSDKKASDFVRGVFPVEVMEEIIKEMNKKDAEETADKQIVDFPNERNDEDIEERIRKEVRRLMADAHIEGDNE